MNQVRERLRQWQAGFPEPVDIQVEGHVAHSDRRDQMVLREQVFSRHRFKQRRFVRLEHVRIDGALQQTAVDSEQHVSQRPAAGQDGAVDHLTGITGGQQLDPVTGLLSEALKQALRQVERRMGQHPYRSLGKRQAEAECCKTCKT